MDEWFGFPQAPRPRAIEWPGAPLGRSNCVTRTKTRTAVHDKGVDRAEGRRDALVEAAVAHISRSAGREPTYVHDVVIHGVRVRATTNSPHLAEFWVDNWYSPEEWHRITGQEPPREPQVTVYALGNVADQQEAAHYSRGTSTIVFFNTAYYGQLKSWVLGAVGRVLAEEHGIHSVHGAAVEKAGQGVLYIAPTGTGKSTSSYGLMTHPQTRFHSDDWVYVRYTYGVRGGGRVHPMRVGLPDGREVRGFRVFRWLEEEGPAHPEARVEGVNLANEPVAVDLGALALDEPIEAHAFTSEKIFYLRTNLVENFPLAAGEMLSSMLENVPEVTGRFLEARRAQLDALLAEIHADGGTPPLPPTELRVALARMIAFDNARAMLDISRVLPAGRVFTNPMEPVHLTTVFLLKRNRGEPVVLEHLPEGAWMARLLIGLTPDGKREIAYNAYRATEDDAERAYIARLEEEVRAAAGDGYTETALYDAYRRRRDVPDTLEEEFELFRVMWRACRTYSLNTVLTADPSVDGLKDAVARTIALIARVVETHPQGVTYTLDTYGELLRASTRGS